MKKLYSQYHLNLYLVSKWTAKVYTQFVKSRKVSVIISVMVVVAEPVWYAGGAAGRGERARGLFALVFALVLAV